VIENSYLNYLLTEVEPVLGPCHGIGLVYAVYVSTKHAASSISAWVSRLDKCSDHSFSAT